MGADCSGYPQKRLTRNEIASQHFLAQQVIDGDGGYASHPTHGDKFHVKFDRLVLEEGWRFFASTNGLFVLAQETAVAGDVIVVLDGAKAPMILRPLGIMGGEQSYMPISGAYVHTASWMERYTI